MSMGGDLSIAQQAEETRELSIAQAQSAARYEMEGAIFMAKKFPRSEDKAYAGIMRDCERTTFAEDATYCFPRGGQKIKGPSVNLARGMARRWGNIRFGVDVIADDDEMRTIRAWAWDVEANSKVTADDTFKKLIWRKNKNSDSGSWIKPDERDLRELTNRRGALAIRNCILNLMPNDFIEDAVKKCAETLAKGAKENIDDTRKKIVLSFSGIGVPVDQLTDFLGHPIESSSPDELAELRTIWKSINDGQSKWAEYISGELSPKEPPKNGTKTVSGASLTGAKATNTENPSKKPQSADDLAAEAYAQEAASGELFDKGHEAHD